MSQDFLSVDEGAAELGVGRATLWKWLRRYDVPTFRVMGQRRTFIRRKDVERLKQPIPTSEMGKAAA